MILNFPFRKKVSQLSYHLIELDIFSLRSFGFFIVPQMIIIQSPEELYGFVKNNIWAHQLYAFLSFPFHNGTGLPGPRPWATAADGPYRLQPIWPIGKIPHFLRE